MSSDPGLRERKKRETRHALRRAALQLVAERGVDDVTVQDIADAADVSARTFFNHFATKEDAIVGDHPGHLQKVRDALAGEPADATPLQVLRAVLVRFAATLGEQREELLLHKAILHDNPPLRAREMAVFGQYERVLVQDVAARSGTDPETDIYPTLAAGVAMAALRAGMYVWRNCGDTTPLADLVERAFDRLASGLPPPAARGSGIARTAPHAALPQRRRGSDPALLTTQSAR